MPGVVLRIFHLAGRGAFDIEVLGYEAVTALLDDHLVTDEGDLFALTEEKLAASPFFVNKQGTLKVNAHQLLANLEVASLRVDLLEVGVQLDRPVDAVGLGVARKLRHFLQCARGTGGDQVNRDPLQRPTAAARAG